MERLSKAVLIISLIAAMGFPSASAFSRKPAEPTFVSVKVLVKFRDGVDSKRIASIVESEGGTVESVLASTGVHIVVLSEGVQVPDAVAGFSSHQEVLYAEPVQKASPLEEK